jgi:Protein of unknown function (DUF4058)
MPGPFPGMDPYLEEPALWTGAHFTLIACVRAALNAVLPSQYVADTGERLYVVSPGRNIYRDTVVVERLTGGSATDRGSVAAVAPDRSAPWRITAEPEQRREPFIEIRAVREGYRVVTVIEFLSPTNKALGSAGRDLYLAKQQQVLASSSHLIEIDLLRQGEHTIAPPCEKLLQRGRWDYLISLHRSAEEWTFWVWPNTLRERLPALPVPLAPSDPDVELDLQVVLDRTYDDGAYARLIDYRGEPTPPLTEDDAHWADALLTGRGLRH